jgi:hypothetical protein
VRKLNHSLSSLRGDIGRRNFVGLSVAAGLPCISSGPPSSRPITSVFGYDFRMNDPFDPLHSVAQSCERVRSGERGHLCVELQSAVSERFPQISEKYVSKPAA